MSKRYKWIKQIDPNLAIAVGVLISSFAALFVYVKQANIMNEQTRILLEQTNILLEQTKANTWPHLSIELWRGSNQNGKTITYKIIVNNKGTGPAILEKTWISYDGIYAESWNDFYQIIEVPDSIQINHSNANIHNRVLASNEAKRLIDWSTSSQDPAGSPLIDFLSSKADKIKIEICYKSIHGDAWSVSRLGFQSDLEDNNRVERDHCSNTDEKIFRQ